MLRARLVTGMLLASALPAGAHPHIFIDAGINAVFDDQGRLAAIRVIWTYDEYYSLAVLEDLGLDSDYDGALTAKEEAQLSGFDMNWIEGFEGDTYGLLGEEKIALSGPLEPTATLVDGRIVTTHLRALEDRIELGETPVIFQAYDPEYYTAYSITLTPRVEGREGCTAQVFVPQQTEANQVLLDALAEVGADETLEDAGFPAVGAQFADEVRITCAPPS